MPCQGPSPQEEAMMNIEANLKLYGVKASELDIATRVACHLAKGETNNLTRRWIAEHDRRDQEKEARLVAEKKEANIQRKLKKLERELRK